VDRAKTHLTLPRILPGAARPEAACQDCMRPSLGMLDLEITWAASLKSSGLGTILVARAGLRSSTSSRSTPASGGISIGTGRDGRCASA